MVVASASQAASARYACSCPTCDAGPFEPCRTVRTQRVTDTHIGRIYVSDELSVCSECGRYMHTAECPWAGIDA